MRDSSFATNDRPRSNGAGWSQDNSWQNDPRFRPDADQPEPEPVKITATPYVWRDPKTFPRRRWLYGHHLIRKYLSCTVAPPGLGKSTLILVEAVALATGRELLGKKVHDGPVVAWVINLEDPLEELERRVTAILLHYGIEPDELGGRLFLDSGRTVKVVLAKQTRDGTSIAEPMVEALKAEIREKQVAALFVDPFVKSHAVGENDNMAIDMVCGAFAGIADETDIAIELVHHVRKNNGATEVTVDDARGASSLLGAVRSARVLNPMSKDEAEKAGGLVAREYFRAVNGKANLAPPPDKSDWHKLVPVSLGNSDSEVFDNADKVAVAEPWEWPDALEAVTVAQLRQVQVAVDAGRFRENHQAKDWVGHAVAKVLGLNAANRVEKKRILEILRTWMGTGMFVIVEGEDEKRMKRSFVEVGEWASD